MDKVLAAIWNYFLGNPKALAYLVCSYPSGHLWYFIITTYFKSKTRGNSKLGSLPGKLTLGMSWFTFIVLPVYVIEHKTINLDYEIILNSVVSMVAVAIFIQVIILGLILEFRRER